MSTTAMQSGSVRPEEIARFDALAARWWDASGPMRPLHMMNPIRAGWVLARMKKRFGTVTVRVLDVGCGAGLLCEALAKAGAEVTGLDAGAEMIEAARANAAGQDLNVTYRAGAAEELVAEGLKFPVITALEVIEHVADPAAFMATLAALLEPGGVVFISTLNRTAQSYVVAKLGAEVVLRLLPVGTHAWRQFITPAELGRFCGAAGLRLADTAGLSFSALGGKFMISKNMKINYLAMAEGK